MVTHSVRGKLLAVVLTLSGVSVGLAVYGWNRMAAIDHRLAYIVDNSAKAEVLAARARAELTGLHRAEKNLLLSPDAQVFAQHLGSMQAHRERLYGLIAEIEPLSSGEALEKVRAFRGLVDQMRTIADEVVEMARADTNHRAEELSITRGEQQYRAVADALESILTDLRGAIAAAGSSPDDTGAAHAAARAAGPALIAGAVAQDLLRIELYEKSIIVADTDEQRLGYEQSLARTIVGVRGQAAQLRGVLDDKNRGMVDTFLTRFDAWMVVHQEIVALAKDNSRGRAENLSRGKGRATFEAAVALMTAVEEIKENEMHYQKDEADRAFARATALMIAFSSVSILTALVISVLLVNKIVKTLMAVVERMRRIAAGDLTGDPITVTSKDEIGQLAQATNDMQKGLREIVMSIGSNSEQVSAAATEVAATSEQMAASSEHQRAQLTQVAAAVEEMAATVTEVSGRTGEVSRQSTDAGNQATEGGDIVRRTVAEMGQIASQVESTSAAVGQLSEKAVKIGEILTVINDIADQTNLLALNAAIEAARAGEHGRGFAVVADEVRKLAERTQEATQEVSRSITEIQTSTTEATEMMDASKNRVTSGVQLAQQAGESLESIVRGSTTVASSIDSIAAAVEEQSATSTEIARSIEVISASADEATQGANQAAAAATQLSGNAESLRELVSRFRV